MIDPAENLNDTDLLALLRRGDHAAFKEIYKRYDKLLYVLPIVKINAWLWNNRLPVPAGATLAAYLYKSVLNKIFNIFRHQHIIQHWVGR